MAQPPNPFDPVPVEEEKTTEASTQTITSSPRPEVPPLEKTLPLDQHSVDEGRKKGYCR